MKQRKLATLSTDDIMVETLAEMAYLANRSTRTQKHGVSTMAVKMLYWAAEHNPEFHVVMEEIRERRRREGNT